VPIFSFVHQREISLPTCDQFNLIYSKQKVMKKAASGYKTIDSFFKHQRQVEDVQEEPKSTPKQISTDTITIDAGKSASGKPLSQSPCSSSQIPDYPDISCMTEDYRDDGIKHAILQGTWNYVADFPFPSR
jgi:hypothetical protein